MKQSERSLQFKKHYLEYFEAGLSVLEIANIYGLSERHAYNLVYSLAEEIGVAYESLLRRPHAEHTVPERKEFRPVKPIDPDGFRKGFRETISSMDKTLNSMTKISEAWTKETEEGDE